MKGIFFVSLLVVVVAGFLQGVDSQSTPIVCWSAPQRAQALEVANTIANIVDNALKLGGGLFKNPENRAVYTNVANKVISALTEGWSAEGVCDSIANSIADPLGQIPVYGPTIVMIVKTPIKGGCELRKQSLGC